MITKVLILGIIILLNSCTEKKRDVKTFDDMPNADTRYTTIQLHDFADDTLFLKTLKANLDEDKFSFTKIEERSEKWSFNNCVENKVLKLQGKSIRHYVAKSIKPLKLRGDNYFPYFTLTVFEFSSYKESKNIFELMTKNLTGRFCNGKSPFRILMRDNEVYYLGTGAEMFSTCLVKYTELIKRIP